MQLLDKVENESQNDNNDDDLDMDECLDRFEKEFIQNMNHVTN